MCYARPSQRRVEPRNAVAERRSGRREEAQMPTRLLTLRDVTAMTALSRSAVYALMA